MFSIGEFSLISRLSIKTLRYYHQIGLLMPVQVNEENGYRFYNNESLRTVDRLIQLKEMGFSLKEIAEIMEDPQTNLEQWMKKKERQIQDKIALLSQQRELISQWKERIDQNSLIPQEEIKLLELKAENYLYVELTGSYDEIGRGFDQILRIGSSYIAGPCFALYHQLEYMEEDARMDACFITHSPVKLRNLNSGELKPRKALSLIHRGPYHRLGNAYKRLLEHCKEMKYNILLPIREIYHKGPGMEGWGDPGKYLTEIQMQIH